MTSLECKDKIKAIKPLLKEKYGVKTIAIFGSYVRGEQGKDSDVDILVEFEKPIGLIRFLELEETIEKILNFKVDLVTEKALKYYVRKNVLREAVFL